MAGGDPTYAIIGGGIVGASIAYHLSRRSDAEVIVHEQGEIGAETTAKSMAMFGLYGDATQYDMKRYGLRLYNEFFADPRTELAYDFAGRLDVATTADGATALESMVEEERDRTPAPRDLIEYVPGDELHEVLLLPNVDASSIVGAAVRPRVGYLRPDALAAEFAARAEAYGAVFRTGVSVTDVLVENGTATGVTTGEGDLAADAVICAAGPWNVNLTQAAGVDVPVRHTLAPVIKVAVDERASYSLPTISHRDSPYAIHRQRARDRGHVYVSYHPSRATPTLEDFHEAYERYDPDELGETVPEEIRDGMTETLDRFLPGIDGEIVDEWVGVRSMTPDGNPIVGWTELPSFHVAAFNTSGIQLAPKTGDVIARQVLDGDPTDLYDGLSVSRFEGYTDSHGGRPPE